MSVPVAASPDRAKLEAALEHYRDLERGGAFSGHTRAILAAAKEHLETLGVQPPMTTADRGCSEPASLLQLAERCEREQPSKALDADIAEVALDRRDMNRADKSFRERGLLLLHSEDDRLNWYEALHYTSSLDAAVSLAPSGWRIQDITQVPTDKLEWNVTLERNPVWRATSQAKTEPMARCAAALRARAHEAEVAAMNRAQSAGTPL